MRKLIASLVCTALAATLALGRPAQDRDDRRGRDDRHDNGKHKGGNKHGEEGDRHDNGKHKGWDNPNNPPYEHWDADHDRIHPGRAYPYGRYEHVREVFLARGIDYRTRRVTLYDNSNWVAASYDLDRCRDWQWDHDQVYVYDDDHHPGWYLLFNARLGRYVHVDSLIAFEVTLAMPSEFAVEFRIPAWAQGASLAVNGKQHTGQLGPGTFASLRREWKTGDRLELRLPMTLRLEPIDDAHPDIVALLSGPLVLFPIGTVPAKLTLATSWQRRTPALANGKWPGRAGALSCCLSSLSKTSRIPPISS